MTPQFMVDTDVAISIVRGTPPEFRQRFEELPLGAFCISAITRAELVYGQARIAQASPTFLATRDFLDRVAALHWPPLAADAFGRIKRHLFLTGQMIGEMDLLIAAHALAADLPLVTGNVRHFGRVPGLTVIDWRDRALAGDGEGTPAPG